MFVYNTQVIKNHGSIIQRLLKIFYKICLDAKSVWKFFGCINWRIVPKPFIRHRIFYFRNSIDHFYEYGDIGKNKD